MILPHRPKFRKSVFYLARFEDVNEDANWGMGRDLISRRILAHKKH